MAAPSPTVKSSPRRRSPALLGCGLVVIAIGFGLPQILPGRATPSESSAVPESQPLGQSLARMAGCLVLVCGLCVIVTRWLGRRAAEVPGQMRVLASARVGNRCVVHLVQAGERRLLLGTDAAGVKALVELPGILPLEPPVPAEVSRVVFARARFAA
jgi:flagellar biogenesis protein FliO